MTSAPRANRNTDFASGSSSVCRPPCQWIRDRLREVEAVGRPRPDVGDHAEEEVGGEEGAEQHHLRDDEEEDAERLAVDPGALVRLGRAVVLGGGATMRSPSLGLRPRGPLSDCVRSPVGRPLPRCARRACRSSPSTSSISPSCEPLRLLAGEGRDQDLVDAVVLDRVLDGRERAPGSSAGRSRRCRSGRARRACAPSRSQTSSRVSRPEGGLMNV